MDMSITFNKVFIFLNCTNGTKSCKESHLQHLSSSVQFNVLADFTQS